MITSNELIKMFERMRDEHWSYVWGSAKEGEVDCSGAFVWAFKHRNQSIPHGSNSIGHKNVEKLLPISEAKPGMAVFRCKPWTDSDDDQKNSYYQMEPGNLSHIGLVGRDGKTVLHASGTKTGFIESKLDSTWSYVAYLKRVDYSEVNQNGSDFGMSGYLKYGQISINSGYVNLRTAPSVTSKVLAHMENGQVLEILEELSSGKWLRVMCKGTVGYAYAKYVVQNGVAIPDAKPDTVMSPAEGAVKAVTIVDSVGNRFNPVGDFTVLLESVD